MADDLASLGFQIDTAPLQRASGEMDKVTAASKRAETATAGFGSGMSRVAASSTASAQAIARAHQMIDRINKAVVMNTGQSDFAGMLQHGQHLDNLRAAYNPLFAAQRNYQAQIIAINGALREGAISERERATAVALATQAFHAQTTALSANIAASQAQKAVSAQIVAGMSEIGRASLAANMANERLVSGMGAAGRAFAAEQAEMAARSRITVEQIATANAGIASHGQQLATLRDRYLPLSAAQRQYAAAQAEINQAVRLGAISERERAQALKTAEMAYQSQVRAINLSVQAHARLRSGAALSQHAMANLAFQINDVATMAAMGVDPFRILATQAGQFYQILQMGEGGVRGSLSYLKDVLVGMITPARLAATGLLGIGVAGVTVATQWQSAQRQITAALIGVGSAAGITAGDINRIATEAVAAGVATAGQARDMALAFASTGKITADLSEELVAIGRRMAVIFGEDLDETGQRLARVFADPAKGVDELNKRLGAFDERTRQTIISLSNQGRLLEAQRMLLDGVKQSTERATDAISDFEKGWNKVKETFSEYANFVGERTALMFGYADTYTKYVDAQDRLAAKLKANEDAFFDFQRTLNQPGINALIKEVGELEAKLAGLAEQAYRTIINLESVSAGEFIRGLVPDIRALSKILDDIGRIRTIRSMPGVVESLPDIEQKGLDRAEKSALMRKEHYKTSLEIAQQEHALTLQTIQARSTADRAAIASREVLNRLLREGDIDAYAKAEMASAEVFAQSAEQVRRFNEQRILSADQSIEQASRELALVGQTAATRERELALLQARQQLEDEAYRLEGDRNAYDRDHLKIIEERVKWQQELNQKIATETTLRELAFERSQMARSEREQSVYGRLDSLGLLTNGEIVGTQAELIAGQIRFNEVMRISQDASKDFASGFIRDMKDGVSATEALANAMNRLADKFLDMAMDDVFSRFFAPFSSAIATGATGWSPAPTTGWGASVFPAYHSGGVVGQGSPMTRYVHPAVFDGAPRYHNGGVAGLRSNEVPAILERGEVVLPKGGGPGSSITVPITINAQGADPATLQRVITEVQTLKQTLPRTVTNLMRDNRQRGYA
jgi:hypothetical protein